MRSFRLILKFKFLSQVGSLAFNTKLCLALLISGLPACSSTKISRDKVLSEIKTASPENSSFVYDLDVQLLNQTLKISATRSGTEVFVVEKVYESQKDTYRTKVNPFGAVLAGGAIACGAPILLPVSLANGENPLAIGYKGVVSAAGSTKKVKSVPMQGQTESVMSTEQHEVPSAPAPNLPVKMEIAGVKTWDFKTGPDGQLDIPLSLFLDFLQRDVPVKISVWPVNEQARAKSIEVNSSSLGVTWDTPRRH